MEILNYVTIGFSALGSAVAAWIAVGRYRREARKSDEEKERQTVELAKKVKQEQVDMEVRLRNEHINSELTQAEIENKFRNEIREEMARVRTEARELQAQLRASEEENRKLRLKIFELELELVRLRNHLPNKKGAHSNTHD